MFEHLLRLWRDGRLTPEQLDDAVERGWITGEEADEIRGIELLDP